MKMNCEIVQDLLVLYDENMCSPASREAVEQHLAECPNCRKLRNLTEAVTIPEVPAEASPEDRTAVKTIRRMRRKWLISLIAVMLLIPLFILSFNEIVGMNVCFTNLDEIMAAYRFAELLEAGDVETAAEMMDFSAVYQEARFWLDRGPEQFGHSDSFQRFQVGDMVVYASRFCDEQFRDLVSAHGEDIWLHLAQHGTGLIPIPEAGWNKVLEDDPGLFQRQGDRFLRSDGKYFYEVKTVWGTLYMDEVTWEEWKPISQWTDATSQAKQFVNRMWLIPGNLFEFVREEIDRDAMDAYEELRAAYGAAEGLTEVEFQARMTQRYAQRLQAYLDQGYGVKNPGYVFSRTVDGGWLVTLNLEVFAPEETGTMNLSIQIRDGKIVDIHGDGSGNRLREFARSLALDYDLAP